MQIIFRGYQISNILKGWFQSDNGVSFHVLTMFNNLDRQESIALTAVAEKETVISSVFLTVFPTM